MSEKLKGIENYSYLISSDVSPFVLKLRSWLGNVRALVILGLGLVVLSGSIAIAWYAFGAADRIPDSRLDDLAYLRRVLFPLTVGIESLALLLVTPAIAIVALAHGWEKESNGFIRGLPKSGYRLIAKGFISATAKALLLPLTAMPLEIVALLPYGISVTDIGTLLSEQVVFLATTFILSATGLLFSSARSWPRWAMRTYIAIFLVTTGPLLVAFPLEALLRPTLTSLSRYQMAYLIWLAFPILLNPVVSALFTTEPSLNVWQTVHADVSHQVMVPPIWFAYTVVCSVTTAVLLPVTVRQLRKYATEHQGVAGHAN